MKKNLTLILTAALCFCSIIMLKAQISPTSSTYYNNGSYSVVSDSTTVNSKKLVMYHPDVQPQFSSKYPVLIFQPGANGFLSSAINVHSYDLYLKHLVTFGYVVLVIDETSAGLPNGATFKAVHDWFKTNVVNTSHWLYNYADSSKVAVGGHSNGGVNATACLIDRPSQIDAIIYFASYPSNNFLLPQDVSGYTGKVLDLVGAADATSTPATCRTGFDAYEASNCGYWVQITGMDHGGFGDYINSSQPVGSIGRANATATVRHFLVSFMESQFKNNIIASANFSTAALQPNTTNQFENSCQVTSIYETGINSAIIYPNPVKDILTIQLNSEIQSDAISLFDITGKKITAKIQFHQIQGNQYSADFSALPKGYYCIRVLEGNCYRSFKVIVI
jgi:pimeloyl-ACP methyl ester carboxylesterase